jgi:hypothetical protein
MSTLDLLFLLTIGEETGRKGDGNAHHDLKPIKAPRFRNLHLPTKPFHQVLIHDPVRSGKERQDVRDEMSLVVGEGVPIGEVFREVLLEMRG